MFVDLGKFKFVKNILLNFGPQHPSAHGVLRLILSLNGEVIVKADPHIGLLHRGTEKLIEFKTFNKALPYLDRLDYVSMMAQEHAFSLSVESLINNIIPLGSQYIGILFLELTGLLNHLLSLTTHALDIGAMTPFLWLFEEGEKLLMFYEGVSGARMHAAYILPSGIGGDIPGGLLDDIFNFCLQFSAGIDELEEILTYNRIWGDRLSGIGNIEFDSAINFSFTGVNLGSVGIPWDLGVSLPYEKYNILNYSVPISFFGDSFDGYLIGLEEMGQSLLIIFLILTELKLDYVGSWDYKYAQPPIVNIKKKMESLIHHFKINSVGFHMLKEFSIYNFTESPKGEFGTFLLVYGYKNVFFRCKFRSPGFYHLQGIDKLVGNKLLSDLVVLIGTQDIVFGEIDR